ncbi:cuticle protein 7-like [Scylla paramamosain]|uniref:cuticle protein 7-like n=1 Tax=Scylla paramamosain TaxID=85552 RepID=UPI003083770F
MSFLKVVALIALVAAASARPESGHSAPAPAAGYGYAPPPPPPAKPEYSFDWAVKDDYAGLDFGQNEHRDGYNTEGAHHVLLPDGRVQKIVYKVSKDGGFMATVEYEGEIRHEPKGYGKTPAPAYTQPPAYRPQPTPAYGNA